MAPIITLESVMDDGWWIVLGVLAFALILNLGLVLSALRYRKANPPPIFGKGIGELFNPWREEDEALKDLQEKVDALKRHGNE
jgi:hypothetical protein